MQMKDNPFVKVSPTTKNYLLLEKRDNFINIRIFNQMRDVPYSDCFNTEEHLIVVSPDSRADKCIVRQTLNVIFKKSTIFKNKITTNATNGIKKNFGHWCNWVQEKIATY